MLYRNPLSLSHSIPVSRDTQPTLAVLEFLQCYYVWETCCSPTLSLTYATSIDGVHTSIAVSENLCVANIRLSMKNSASKKDRKNEKPQKKGFNFRRTGSYSFRAAFVFGEELENGLLFSYTVCKCIILCSLCDKRHAISGIAIDKKKCYTEVCW